jgi:transposase/transposase-like protein
MRSASAPLRVTDEQRSVLEKLWRSRTAPHRDVQRARVLLMASDGFANTRIASEVGVAPATVTRWRERFREDGLKNFSAVRSGRGRKPSIPVEKVEEIVDLTLHETPCAETHWSCRTMAARAGVSPATVQRIWAGRGLKPHQVKTFKLSNDPKFEQKLVDVVGLYLNPPENAIVLCMDEKSQIQALDRTQPSLPIKPGRAGTMTHDYKRNGTTTLFAALDVLTGSVIGQCLPGHRHTEFLEFLRTIGREVPEGLHVHVILDNYATHNHPNVNKWLAKHPRFELHFTPTSSLWVNMVEIFFGRLSDKPIRRGIFKSVPDLIEAIEGYLAAHNENPKPFEWTATAEQILEKVRRGRVTLDAITH